MGSSTKSLNISPFKMTQMFEIKEIEGKGLGWVATKDIRRGTVMIWDIYDTIVCKDGVDVNSSRLNHSCRANALRMTDEIRVISKIKEGEKMLFESKQMICHCNFCNNDTEDEMDFELYRKFREVEELKKNRDSGNVMLFTGFQKSVDLYKDMYKIGKEKDLSPKVLFSFLKDGFGFGHLGFLQLISKEENTISEQKQRVIFKDDCERFAKAAEKFNKILGNELVDIEYWKPRQDFERFLLEDMRERDLKIPKSITSLHGMTIRQVLMNSNNRPNRSKQGKVKGPA